MFSNRARSDETGAYWKLAKHFHTGENVHTRDEASGPPSPFGEAILEVSVLISTAGSRAKLPTTPTPDAVR